MDRWDFYQKAEENGYDEIICGIHCNRNGDIRVDSADFDCAVERVYAEFLRLLYKEHSIYDYFNQCMLHLGTDNRQSFG